MLLNEQSLALQKTVHEMGYESLEDLALKKARQYLLMQYRNTYNRIRKFQEKYGQDYTAFCKNFHELKYPLFEKEEDSGEWKAEIRQLSILKERLESLV